MPRTARLTDIRPGRAALLVAGAAAALTCSGAGLASAAVTGAAGPATAAAAAMPATAATPAAGDLTAAPGALTTTRTTPATPAAPARTAAARVTTPGPAGGRGQHAPAATAPAAVRGAVARTTPAGPARPYEIYDSTTPAAIPAGHEEATYADGAFAVPAAQVAGHKVIWIDTNGTDTRAGALDVEPGDVTPAGAGTWAAQKLHADPAGTAIIYTMRSDWTATQAAVDAALPAAEHSHIRWWIADPTGTPHLVPGSAATQWYWGPSYDISTATPGF
jgi:hypothetical protein